MLLALYLSALSLFLSPEVACNPDAKRLYDDLLSNYNRLIRPVSNHTEKVTVKLGLRLSQLVDLVRISKLFKHCEIHLSKQYFYWVISIHN